MLGIFINNSSLLESNSKYIFKNTDFNPPFAFWTKYLQINFVKAFNNSYSFKSYSIIQNFVIFYSCWFYNLNLIFSNEYFIKSSQFSGLPSVFNLMILIEFSTNHLLYFKDFMQLNSSKDSGMSGWGEGCCLGSGRILLQVLSALCGILNALFCPLSHFKIITLLKVFYNFTKFLHSFI